MIKLIVAVDRANAIGWSDGRLPWHLPEDMKRFKKLTMGSTVLMGRRTFESLNRPEGLPGRLNVVLTHNPGKCSKSHTDNPLIFDNLSTFVQVHQACLGCTPPDLWIIGGASIYAQALEQQLVDELYLTLVHENSGADITLPFELAAWKSFILHQKKLNIHWELLEHSPEGPAGASCTFITLKKL